MVEIKGTMDELKEIFIGAAIFGAKAEVKRQGAKLGKKVVQKGAEATVDAFRESRKVQTRIQRRAAKDMSKALKLANEKLRNKNGSLKKGKTQADVMRLAQKIRRQNIKPLPGNPRNLRGKPKRRR